MFNTQKKTTQDRAIKILQANVGRKLSSQNLARAIGTKLECDIVCVQEPSVRLTNIPSTCSYPSESPDKLASIQNLASGPRGYQVTSSDRHKNFVFVEGENLGIYSVYISPNCTLLDFESAVDSLFIHVLQTIQAKGNSIIICGDFNAKHEQWGGQVTDNRGKMLLAAVDATGLTVLNDKKYPTLIRHNGTSYIDLTIVSEDIVKRGYNWNVLHEEETLSDHQFITLELHGAKLSKRRYIQSLNSKLFQEKLQKRLANWDVTNTDAAIQGIKHIYLTSRHRLHADNNYRLPYWWNDTIEEGIKNLKRRRRKLQRETQNEANRLRLREQYKEERKRVSKEIARAKKHKWKELCKSLEEDIFGEAYKIIKSQLKCSGPKIWLKQGEKVQIFEKLFQTIPTSKPQPIATSRSHTTRVTEAELEYAISRIKTGKSPGPDQMLPEHIKTMLIQHKTFFASLYSDCIEKAYFPTEWKNSKLILIEKPSTEESAQKKYRPICLLDVLGKVLETIINERLKSELERVGGLTKTNMVFEKAARP